MPPCNIAAKLHRMKARLLGSLVLTLGSSLAFRMTCWVCWGRVTRMNLKWSWYSQAIFLFEQFSHCSVFIFKHWAKHHLHWLVMIFNSMYFHLHPFTTITSNVWHGASHKSGWKWQHDDNQPLLNNFTIQASSSFGIRWRLPTPINLYMVMDFVLGGKQFTLLRWLNVG